MQPLAGKTIVVTRPAAQAGPLAEAIRAAGGTPLLLPLLEILPADGNELAEAIRHLSTATLAIFISPNAVEHALPAILAQGPWPALVTPAAVGPGTVKSLRAFGITNCIAPTRQFDSEALLALPELADARVAGKRILIFRGNGGRELLADTLRERGASVDCVTCYQRRAPAQGIAPLLAALEAGEIDGITVSSSEALRHLSDSLDAESRHALMHTPLFVPHARIAETAYALGLSRVVLTEPADAGLIAGLCAYNWQKT